MLHEMFCNLVKKKQLPYTSQIGIWQKITM